MPLSGALLADFSSFTDACQKAEVSLKSFETGAGKVEASLNRATNSLSGVKIVQQANIAAEAVERIGGVSKLTEQELGRIGATATEAAAKCRALGDDVPPKIQALADAARNVSGELTSFGNAARSAGVTLTAALTVPIVGVGAAAIKLGIDAVESRNLIEVSFGDMTKAADQWAAQTSKDLGLNRYETEKTAGVLFNMTTSMGLGRAAAFEMSTGVVKLAGDMASFRNIPMEEALTKIKSGLTGETEPLKAIGILVDEATVKTFAYTHGIAAQGTELSAQQKVLARYGSILAQTSNDQGDLARTLESPANQLRIMKERVTEAATALGVSLLPMVQTVIGWVAQLVPKIQDAVTWFGNLSEPVKVGGVLFLGFVAAVGPALVIVGQLAISVAGIIPLLKAMGVEQATITATATTAGSAMTIFATGASAIAAAFVGWQIGKQIADVNAFGLTIGEWVPVLWNWKLGLGESSLELLKTSEAANRGAGAHAAAAAVMATLAAETAKVTDAMRKEIAAQQELATKAAAVAAAQAASKAELKAYTDAMVEINSVGKGWQGTLDTISGSVVEAIKFYLQAGVAQGALAAAYGLTASQVKSVASALKDETDALKVLGDFHTATHKIAMDALRDEATARTKALAERNASVVAGLKEIQDIEKRAADLSAQQTLSATDYQILKIREAAAADIQAFKGTLEQRQQFTVAVNALADQQAQAIIASAAKSAAAINGVTSAYWAQIDAAARAAGVTVIGNRPGEGPGINGALPGAASTGFTLAGGSHFSDGGIHPLRDFGGPVSAGSSYLIGLNKQPELFTPGASGFITPLGGGPTINVVIHVNGTAADVARQITDEIMKTAKSARQFGAA